LKMIMMIMTSKHKSPKFFHQYWACV
jgi:hypothetical protein